MVSAVRQLVRQPARFRPCSRLCADVRETLGPAETRHPRTPTNPLPESGGQVVAGSNPVSPTSTNRDTETVSVRAIPKRRTQARFQPRSASKGIARQRGAIGAMTGNDAMCVAAPALSAALLDVRDRLADVVSQVVIWPASSMTACISASSISACWSWRTASSPRRWRASRWCWSPPPRSWSRGRSRSRRHVYGRGHTPS